MYSSTAGAIACQQCAPGSYTNSIYVTQCTPCSSGSYTNSYSSTSCSSCAGGSYAEQPNSTSCVACPVGKFSSDGAAVCQQCTPGRYLSNPVLGTCTQCAKNTYSLAGYSTCTPCNRSFSVVGSSACNPCPEGTCSPLSSSTCSACPAGYYCPLGCTTAVLCPRGLNSPALAAQCLNSYPLWGVGLTNPIQTFDLTSGTVQLIDSSLGTISTGSLDISTDGSYILFLDNWHNTIIKIILNGPGILASVLSIAGFNQGFNNGVGTNALFSSPSDISLSRDGKFALVADTGNNMIRYLNLASNAVSTIAGTSTAGTVDGAGSTSRFNGPISICITPDSTAALVVQGVSTWTLRTVQLVPPYNVATLFSAPAGYITPAYVRFSLDGTQFLVADPSYLSIYNYPSGTLIASSPVKPNYASYLGVGTIVYTPYVPQSIRVNLNTYNISSGGTQLQIPNFGLSWGVAAWKCLLPGYAVDSYSPNCVQCSPGTYGVGNGFCSSCAIGTVSPAGAVLCCPVGQFANNNNSQCVPCPAGMFYNIAASTCMSCAAGTFTNTTSMYSCLSCATPTPASFCPTCSANALYAPTAAATACLQCPSYALSSIDGTTCMCQPGNPLFISLRLSMCFIKYN